MLKAKVILALVLLFLIITFILQNTDTVGIRFLFWNFSLSRALLIFLLLAVGALVGFISGTMSRPRPRP